MGYIDRIKYLYHGTDQLFTFIDLSYSRRMKDFGKGNMTSHQAQALKWAKYKSGGRKAAYVIRYPFCHSEGYDELPLLKYDKEWLDFIMANRNGDETVSSDYDLIYDRMADGRRPNNELDKVLFSYKAGYIHADEAISRIMFRDVDYDQYCLKTKKSLNLLDERGRTVYGYFYREGKWNKEDITSITTLGRVR